MKTSHITYDGYNLLTLESYGNAPYESVIIVPHGYQGSEFREKYPQFNVFFEGVSEEVQKQYLSEEADIYAPELARCFAEKLYENNKSVCIVHINIERGICDANRIEPYAVRKFINFKKHHEVVGLLRDMNSFSRDNVLRILKEELSPSGFFIDLHTMGCYSRLYPSRELEKPGMIEKYTDFLRSKNTRKGPKRGIDILTHHNGIKIIEHDTDAGFFRYCKAQLQLPIEYNTPYELTPRLASFAYHSIARGISIDFPRYLVSSDEERKALSEGILLL